MLKKLFYLFLILVVVGGIGAYWAYNNIFIPNTAFDDEEMNIQIPKNSSYEDVLGILKDKNVIVDEVSFNRVAQWMNYQRAVCTLQGILN